MAGLEVRGFDAPDETRTPDKTLVEVIGMGGTTAARLDASTRMEAVECVKPVARTESRQARHVGIVQSGRMHVT